MTGKWNIARKAGIIALYVFASFEFFIFLIGAIGYFLFETKLQTFFELYLDVGQVTAWAILLALLTAVGFGGKVAIELRSVFKTSDVRVVKTDAFSQIEEAVYAGLLLMFSAVLVAIYFASFRVHQAWVRVYFCGLSLLCVLITVYSFIDASIKFHRIIKEHLNDFKT